MAHNIYKVDGKRVPSVTTVLKQLGWSCDALMYWAWKQGMDGKNFREFTQNAADVGTYAHSMVEADIKCEEFDLNLLSLDEEMHNKVMRCYSAWQRWKDQNKLQMINAEESLVSKKYLYGGTLDIAAILGNVSIIDIKTGSGVYDSHLCQLAAYGMLYAENHDTTVHEYHIIRLGRDDGSFHHHSWTDLSLPLQAFLNALELYNLHKKIKKMI